MQRVRPGELLLEGVDECWVVFAQDQRHRVLDDAGADPHRVPLDAGVAQRDAKQHLRGGHLGLLQVLERRTIIRVDRLEIEYTTRQF